MENCIFCDIIARDIQSNILYEDNNILVFEDIEPSAKKHCIIIPKIHITSINEVSEKNLKYVSNIFLKIKEISKLLSIDESGYRIVTNCGKDAYQTVNHLHFHIVGGHELSPSFC